MSDVKKTLLSLLLICFVVTLGCMPLILYGPQTGFDLNFHLPWSHLFAEQVFQGEIYPRWLMDVNAGAGNPVFFFYPPVAFYFSTVAIALFGECSAPVQLGIGQFFIMLASAFSFFIFARQYAQHFTAALGAILYSFTPYHFGMGLLIRQAHGETTAFVWIPLVFVAIDRVILGKKNSEVWLALAYAMLVMTHLPSALLSSPFYLIYVLVQSWFQKRPQLVIRFLLSVAVGLMIAGCYLIPALTTQGYISKVRLFTPYFDYHRWFFLDGRVAPNGKLESQLLHIAVVNSLFFVLAWPIAMSYCSRALKPLTITLLIIFTGSWFLMTPASAFVWELLPILKKVQFPWRVMILQDFASVATIALALAVSIEQKKKIIIYLASCLFLAMITWASYTTITAYDDHRVLWQSSECQEKLELVAKGESPIDAFQPASVKVPRNVLLKQMPDERVLFSKNRGDVRVVQWQPRDIVLEMKLRKETRVIIKQIHYPGWEVYDDVTGKNLSITPHPQLGLIQFLARPGEYKVRIRLRALWQEQLGWVSTGIGLLIILLFLARN